jgi:predicted lipid-binding transport protein (Tim44 family)
MPAVTPSPAPAAMSALTSEPAAPKWPPGFDAPAFIAQAREQFIRLQAAFDHADLATLREVASTEVFDELRRQIDERHGATNLTEVMSLDTDLVEVQTDVDEYTATIRFHGLVREAPGTEPVRLNELWHLAKPRDGSAGWLLVGIQNPG